MDGNGTSHDAREGVARLKELLFDSEAQALAGLERRLGAIEEASTADARERLETVRRIENLFQRAGTEDRFRSSVAVVLDKALAEAELRNHDGLARALAPLVINTVKVELKNSQDELVEILYPITGRMVQAYIKSAIKDLTDQINERIDHNPLMLRLRALTTGKSVAELAIAESQRLDVDEIFLIRRGSGELIARWPDVGRTSNADIHMSGVLAAINEFAATAFAQEGGHFRAFAFEHFQVFVRASPAYILAARCSGIPPGGIEQIFDDEFIATLERVAAVETAARETEAEIGARDLAPFAAAVEDRTATIYDENARSGFAGAFLKLIVFLLAVPLLTWFFWGLYTDAEQALVRRAATAVVSEADGLAGYPATLDVGYRGRSLTLTGLAPDDPTRRALEQALRQELPGTEIINRLNVIPVAATADTAPLEARMARRIADLERDIAASTALRAVERARHRLGEAAIGLDRLATDTGAARPAARVGETRDGLARVVADIEILLSRLNQPGDGPAALTRFVSPLHGVSGRIAGLAAGLAEDGETPAAERPRRVPDTITAAAESLASEAERVATLVAALAKAARLVPPPPELPAPVIVQPPPPPPAPAEPTPEERLARFVARNAFFFSSNTEFVSPADAARTLDEAARLIAAVDGTLIRVVGYTDSQGGQQQNSPLAVSRAQRVADELAARGIPPERLVVVGRINGYFDVSPAIGSASPNRRVELEMGFIGERRAEP